MKLCLPADPAASGTTNVSAVTAHLFDKNNIVLLTILFSSSLQLAENYTIDRSILLAVAPPRDSMQTADSSLQKISL